MLGKYVGKVCWNKNLHKFRDLDTAVYWAACWINSSLHYLLEDVTLTQTWCNKWAKFLLLALKKSVLALNLYSLLQETWTSAGGYPEEGNKIQPGLCTQWGFILCFMNLDWRLPNNCERFYWEELSNLREKTLSLVLLVSCIHAREFCCKGS